MSESQAIDQPRAWWKELVKRRRVRLEHHVAVAEEHRFGAPPSLRAEVGDVRLEQDARPMGEVGRVAGGGHQVDHVLPGSLPSYQRRDLLGGKGWYGPLVPGSEVSRS